MRLSSGFLALAASSAIAIAAPAGAATYTYAKKVVWEPNGTVGSSNNRNVSANALGAPDGTFLSLGLTNADGSNPGFAVFDFGTMFSGQGIVVETTFNCSGDAATCAGYPEQVEVGFGKDYNFNSHDFSDLADFTFAKSYITNGDAQGSGKAFTIANGPFRYLALIDRSALLGTRSTDGFDVDAVGVTAVPLPAALPLLAVGLGVLSLMGRRRRAA